MSETNVFMKMGKSKRDSFFKRKRYLDFIKTLTLTVEQYEQFKRAFQGGFTHANAWWVDKIMYNVISFDFTSSYPYVMVAEKYPMSSPEDYRPTSKEDFKRQLKLYCCIFDIEITDLQPKFECENYFSISRCRNVKKPYQVNNGRVVNAHSLCTTMTEQDFIIFEKFYTFKSYKIRNFRRMKKGYLPRDIVLSILQMYEGKTTLKGVEGEEVRYLNFKEMINSCYGMTVTDIVRNEWGYSYNKWTKNTVDAEKQINKYNNSSTRFLYYPWGVWVTAYARKNLFTAIYEFQDDYIYSDTDSIKVINYEKHMTYINKYNDMVNAKLKRACDFHKIDFEMTRPKTKKGEKKPLGVWDFDGHYLRFKTLGAKRYMVEYSNDKRNKEKLRGKISLTVSGVNKDKAVPYLIKEYGNKIFDAFENKLKIPEEYCGKSTHIYIDDRKQGVMKDYLGNYYQYDELSAVHLSKTSYEFSRAKEYSEYLKDVQLYD